MHFLCFRLKKIYKRKNNITGLFKKLKNNLKKAQNSTIKHREKHLQNKNACI